MKHTWIPAALVAATLAAQSLTVAAQGPASPLPERVSRDQGVTVTVKPGSLAGDAKTWSFEVVLDTHSQDLSDDLVKSAVLLDGEGRRYTPIAWDGAGAGGHHRKGTLQFNPISPPPQAIELQIRRAGETSPRVFRWELK